MAEERRLAAVVVGDVVGYSAMMGRNESDTLARIFAFQAQVLELVVAGHGGRIVKTTGDGFLAEFSSAVNAVKASVAIQNAMLSRDDAGDPLRLRIGVHVGDVAIRDDDIFGDSVNIAARLEQRAHPGSVLISASVHQQLEGHDVAGFVEIGALDLKNIARPVVAWQWEGGTPVTPTTPSTRADRPSIAVMPFDNLSSDQDQDFLADGVVQDLINNLSRFHWFRVIARASTYAVERDGLTVDEIASRLGARYLLQGSVRRSGNRIRITVELIDASSGDHLWAERIDRTVDDLFEVQDEIVTRIVGSVVPEFVAAVGSIGRSGEQTAPSSWEMAMRGWSLVWRLDGSEATILEARRHFNRALQLDPENGMAHAGLAFSYGNPFYLAGLERDVDRALEEAGRATTIDPRDAFGWCLLGASHMWNESFDEAERHLKRAIALNPSLALAHIYLAAICSWRGDVTGADTWTATAVKLSPADPMLPFARVCRAMARFVAADYKGALLIADEVLSENRGLPSVWRVRAASLESMGEHELAAESVRQMERLAPITMSWARENLTPFTDPERWQAYLSALESAGIPPG